MLKAGKGAGNETRWARPEAEGQREGRRWNGNANMPSFSVTLLGRHHGLPVRVRCLLAKLGDKSKIQTNKMEQ